MVSSNPSAVRVARCTDPIALTIPVNISLDPAPGAYLRRARGGRSPASARLDPAPELGVPREQAPPPRPTTMALESSSTGRPGHPAAGGPRADRLPRPEEIGSPVDATSPGRSRGSPRAEPLRRQSPAV